MGLDVLSPLGRFAAHTSMSPDAITTDMLTILPEVLRVVPRRISCH
jgi:hypothetical protein